MPNIELLMDKVAQAIKISGLGDIFFSTHDLRYANAHLPLDQKIREQCTFSLGGLKKQAPINSQRDFTDWRICQPNFKKRNWPYIDEL